MAPSAASVAETPQIAYTEAAPSVSLRRRYVHLTGWIWTAKLVLQTAQFVGWIVALPLLYVAPALVILLWPHPIVMIAASQQLALWVFLSIGVLRLLIGTPVNYLLGRQNAAFILSTRKHEVRVKRLRKPFGHAKKLTAWLMKTNSNWLLAATFCFRVVPIMPPMVSLSMMSGAARIGLKRLLAVDLLAICVYLYLLMLIGNSLDPMEWFLSVI